MNSATQIQRRWIYCNKMQMLDQEKLIFIDHTEVSFEYDRKREWMTVEGRISDTSGMKDEDVCSVMVCMNIERILKFALRRGRFESE
jgi:hypothetical protein